LLIYLVEGALGLVKGICGWKRLIKIGLRRTRRRRVERWKKGSSRMAPRTGPTP
jgi:hypothetical protein